MEEVKKKENMKKAGKVVALILCELRKNIKTGFTGKKLESIAKQMMKENNVESSCLGYENFPASICVSVSNSKKSELTHGIPDDFPFEKGDLVSVDVSCFYRDENNLTYHADAALTKIVDQEDDHIKNDLLKVTRDSLYFTINKIIPGKTTTRDIGKIIEYYVRSHGYHVIKEFGGHGIGHQLHEKPFIPNFKCNKENEVVIRPGMFICIEPLVQINDNKITKKKVKKWEVIVSTNGFLNAHFEHTLYIDEHRAIVLTNYDALE